MFYIFFCLALASITSVTNAYYLTNPYDRHSRSTAESRLGYASSIVHDDDQKASSSINVDFGSFEAQKTDARQYKGKVNFNPSGAQFYNVGYSVSFNGRRSPVPKRQASEHVEIITGRAKKNEQVNAPPNEFVSHALATQKHLISGIKPKAYPARPLEKPGKGLLEQASSFSSKTQHHIKGLEKTKALQLANRKYKTTQGSDYGRWKHLGSGVEIVKSAEIPVSVGRPREVTKFNHAGALESSQQFDASNVLGNADSDMFGNDRQRSGYVGRNQQFPAKLPVDMSLLRDPVIVTNAQNVPNDPNVIPIHFDLRSLQMVAPTDANYGYREENEENLDEGSQSYPGEDAYEDHEPAQSQIQYRVYGKPQPQPLDSFRYTNTPINVKKSKKSDKPREPRFGSHFGKYGTVRLPPLGQKFF